MNAKNCCICISNFRWSCVIICCCASKASLKEVCIDRANCGSGVATGAVVVLVHASPVGGRGFGVTLSVGRSVIIFLSCAGLSKSSERCVCGQCGWLNCVLTLESGTSGDAVIGIGSVGSGVLTVRTGGFLDC